MLVEDLKKVQEFFRYYTDEKSVECVVEDKLCLLTREAALSFSGKEEDLFLVDFVHYDEELGNGSEFQVRDITLTQNVDIYYD